VWRQRPVPAGLRHVGNLPQTFLGFQGTFQLIGTLAAMSGLPIEVNLDFYRGDSWSQTFQLLDSTGSGTPLRPHDLSASTLASSARGEDGTLTALTCAGTGNPGELMIAAPSPTLPAGDYMYDVQVTTGSDILTWVKGRLLVRPDVTP
jgi:hypothetical protein